MICDRLVFPFLDQTLLLLCQKAIYWEEEKALIAADVHLGKGGHFRKAGIAVPRELAQDDLAVLSDLIREHHPEKLIFLGDLFHSDINTDWDWFALWREQFPKLEIILIRGNHDVIHDSHYQQLHISLHEQMQIGPFLMLHHPLPPLKLEQASGYVLCGHIHPGVLLRGRGRQSITLPCFAFADKQAILPSFGRFTGRVAIQHQQTDQVFGVLSDKVVRV
ncbi:ligase-associated DNA damage response endonuclease PdeM [Mucilaginibacter paludis]|uniref:Metallophosphoesterase n=1 Tax=Mucilaginibacter paludis DSM 18603 TaxID=714943 RepID=H1YIR1_9SPHI|nr:ligase-associated DNA damage response endonuclease PdeM [Mucilaginibacter paludis]EHQ27606.1 metallophosphoesterase [Mucilaginibacter paludis DSM 18603]